MIRALFFVLAAFVGAASALAQSPHRLEFKCSDADISELGLSCSAEEPCPIFAEFTAVSQAGPRIIIAGNLHTASQTIYAFLLASDDGGRTFTEPHARIRAAVLEQIQFADLETGWVGGHNLLPLPRDPFVLMTTDGGKTFRQRQISDEAQNGVLEQFWFDTKRTGKLVIRRGSRHELWESMTGGESWSLNEVKSARIALPRESVPSLRLRADKTDFHLERRNADKWESIASFPLKVGDCRPPDPETDEAKKPEAPAGSVPPRPPTPPVKP